MPTRCGGAPSRPPVRRALSAERSARRPRALGRRLCRNETPSLRSAAVSRHFLLVFHQVTAETFALPAVHERRTSTVFPQPARHVPETGGTERVEATRGRWGSPDFHASHLASPPPTTTLVDGTVSSFEDALSVPGRDQRPLRPSPPTISRCSPHHVFRRNDDA